MGPRSATTVDRTLLLLLTMHLMAMDGEWREKWRKWSAVFDGESCLMDTWGVEWARSYQGVFKADNAKKWLFSTNNKLKFKCL